MDGVCVWALADAKSNTISLQVFSGLPNRVSEEAVEHVASITSCGEGLIVVDSQDYIVPVDETFLIA